MNCMLIIAEVTGWDKYLEFGANVATVLTAVASWFITVKAYNWYKRRNALPRLNFTFVICEGAFASQRVVSQRQLWVLIRNWSGEDILIGGLRMKISDDKCVSDFADRDSETGEYELKFRPDADCKTSNLDANVYGGSYTVVKSNGSARTYLPLSDTDELSLEEIKKMLTPGTRKWLMRSCSRLHFHVVRFSEKKNTIAESVSIVNVQIRSPDIYNREDFVRSELKKLRELISNLASTQISEADNICLHVNKLNEIEMQYVDKLFDLIKIYKVNELQKYSAETLAVLFVNRGGLREHLAKVDKCILYLLYPSGE